MGKLQYYSTAKMVKKSIPVQSLQLLLPSILNYIFVVSSLQFNIALSWTLYTFFLFQIFENKRRQFQLKTYEKMMYQMMNSFKSAMQMFAKDTLCKMAHPRSLYIQVHYPPDKIVKYLTHLFRANFSNLIILLVPSKAF